MDSTAEKVMAVVVAAAVEAGVDAAKASSSSNLFPLGVFPSFSSV